MMQGGGGPGMGAMGGNASPFQMPGTTGTGASGEGAGSGDGAGAGGAGAGAGA